jgi:hypothetical protein
MLPPNLKIEKQGRKQIGKRGLGVKDDGEGAVTSEGVVKSATLNDQLEQKEALTSPIRNQHLLPQAEDQWRRLELSRAAATNSWRRYVRPVDKDDQYGTPVKSRGRIKKPVECDVGKNRSWTTSKETQSSAK